MKNNYFFLWSIQLLTLICILSLASCVEQNDHFATSFDGNKIHYIEEGKGKTALVFVHGWSGAIDNWNNQLPEFVKDKKVIALDLAGFGESEGTRDQWEMESFGKDIVAVLEDAKIDKAILVGHSMGGFTIVEAAKLDPDRIIGLIPVDVFHNPEELATDEEIEIRILRTLDYVRNADTSSTEIIRPGWEESLYEALNWKNNDLRNILSEIDVPIICINSDRFPIRFDKALKYNSNMDYKIVKGTGHGVMVEAPDEFNTLLSEAIKEIETKKPKVDEPKLNYEQAELMTAFLKAVSEKKLNQDEVDNLMTLEGTKLIVAQMNKMRMVSPEQYQIVLSKLLEDEMPDIEPVNASKRAELGVKGLFDVWRVLQYGAENISLLEEQVQKLIHTNTYRASKLIAEAYLPKPIERAPNLFMVVGGRAGAAAIDEDLYFDILKSCFAKDYKNEPQVSESDIVSYFAHEMHHVGYGEIVNAKYDELILTQSQHYAFRFLSAIISEGSATYLISENRDISFNRDSVQMQNYMDEVAELLKTYEKVLIAILNGEITTDEQYDQATSDFMGAGYHKSGTILLRIIDKTSGLDPIMEIMNDPRKLLTEYNKAADLYTDHNDESVFKFDNILAERVTEIGM